MSRARRLYAPVLPMAAGVLELDEDACRHARVLRLRAGDTLCLFDAQGGEADARVLSIDKRELTCEVQASRFIPARDRRLTLVVCVPKAAKLELIVRMACELGVSAIVLAESERSVPRLSAESPKVDRLRRIALEACAQSEQAWAPALSGPSPLSAAAETAPAEAAKLVFWEGASLPLSAAIAAREVWAVVGPEGGISDQEVSVLEARGYSQVSLGSAILRMETACVVVSSLLLDRLGMLR